MESLVINGEKFISSKRAAELMGYTQDYIGQLARAGKIRAERVSGVWYVSEAEFPGATPAQAGGGSHTDTHEQASKINTQGGGDRIMLEGNEYISSKRAAELMGYTQDYIGQLARAGKIEARQVGRTWYIPAPVVEGELEEPAEEVIEESVVVAKHSEMPSDVGEVAPAKEAASPVKIDVRPSLSYSIDDKPLIPSPQRSVSPLLHEILEEEVREPRKEESSQSGRRAPMQRVTIEQDQRESLKMKRGERIVADTARTRTLPLFRTIATAAAVVLVSFTVSYAPHMAQFKSGNGASTGMEQLAAVFQSNSERNNVYDQAKTPFADRAVSFFVSIFESEIEYKAK